MQAIRTKYHGPSNVRGSRVSAQCDAARIIIGWDHRLNSDGNHANAAATLAAKLGWDKDAYGELIGGTLHDGTHAFVFVNRNAERVTQ
jgi:hypothetical protein